MGKKPKEKDLEETMSLYTLTPDDPVADMMRLMKKDYKFKGIKFQTVDCIENKYYCEDEGIKEFPTIHYQNIYEKIVYKWAFTPQDLYDFTFKLRIPLDFPIHSNEALSLMSSSQSAFVLYFNPDMTGMTKTEYIGDYMKLARKYKSTHVYLGTCTTYEYAQIQGLEPHQLPMLLQLGKDQAYKFSISKVLNYENMEQFIENHKCTMSFEITKSFYNEALECFKDKVVGISIYDFFTPFSINDPAHTAMLMKEFRHNSDFRFQFAYVDIENFPEFLERFERKSAPNFIVVDFREGGKTFYLGEFDLSNTEKLKNVLESVWNRKDLEIHEDEIQGNNDNQEIEGNHDFKDKIDL